MSHSLLSQAGPHGFPGDALVSPLSHCQFGFTQDFLHDVSAHFKMRVMKLWDTSPCVRFMSTHHHPSTFLLSHTVVQADGAPPLTLVPEVSSMLEAPSTAQDTDVTPQPSFWTMPSADDVPQSILHCSLPGVPSGDVPGAITHASS